MDKSKHKITHSHRKDTKEREANHKKVKELEEENQKLREKIKELEATHKGDNTSQPSLVPLSPSLNRQVQGANQQANTCLNQVRDVEKEKLAAQVSYLSESSRKLEEQVQQLKAECQKAQQGVKDQENWWRDRIILQIKICLLLGLGILFCFLLL